MADNQITIELAIENVYFDEVINTTATVTCEPPWDLDTDEEMDDWAGQNLADFTGTGRDGYATYTVTITRCDDLPVLVGREFGWDG